MVSEPHNRANDNEPYLCRSKSRPVSKHSKTKKRIPRAHKERYRDTENLKRSQVDELYEATSFAAAIGTQLQTFVTVSWNHTTYQFNSVSWGKSCKRLKRLIGNLGLKATYVYVHENPQNDYPNTHFLIHCGKISLANLKAVFESAFGAVTPNAVDVRPRRHWHLPYLIKGASQQTNRAYGRNRTRGGQGTVSFKRCGTSQNIGGSARKGA